MPKILTQVDKRAYVSSFNNIWIPLSGRMAGNDFCGAAGMKQTLKSSPPRLPRLRD